MQTTVGGMIEKNLARLPSMPGVLVELIACCDSETASFHQIASLVGKDPALTARLFAVGNSALFRRPRAFSSLEAIMMTLGLRLVKTLVVTASVQQFFERLGEGSGLDLRPFWRHSLYCAAASRLLAVLSGYPAPAEAQVAGLLSNLGQLALAVAHPSEYEPMLALSLFDDLAVPEMEKERFGFSHAEFGARIIEEWGMQSHIADAVRYHHETADMLLDAPHLLRIVSLANRMSASDVEARVLPWEDAHRLLGLTREMTGDIQRQAREETGEIAQALRLDAAEMNGGEAPKSLADDPFARIAHEQALLGAIRAPLDETDDAAALHETVVRCTRMLFDFEPILFLYDSSERRLKPADLLDGVDYPISDIVINCAAGESLLAQAVKEGIPLWRSAELGTEGWPVIDRQICARLGGAGLLCVPLVTRAGPVGLLVGGCDRLRNTDHETGFPLLRLFARDAGEALERFAARRNGLERACEERDSLWTEQARDLVHEANNPLSLISNYLYLLGQQLKDNPDAGETLGVVREEIGRVSALLRRFTEIEVDHESQLAPVDINQLIARVLRIMRDQAATTGIELRITTDPSIPPIVTRSDRLRQVVLNLVKNACEALDSGGIVEVTTRDHVIWNDLDCVEIVVSDNGPGLPAYVRERLFRPVRSSKGGGHAGVGLSIARNLVDELGGELGCRTAPDKGTQFQILLPRRLADDSGGTK